MLNKFRKKNKFILPRMHSKPSTGKMALSRLAIIFTSIFWIMYIFSIIIRQLIEGPGNYQFTMEAFGYAVVVTVLSFSSLMYLIARHGALERFLKHSRVPRAILDKFFYLKKPSITVLIPSYKEENEVIRKTLLSAALQEYPELRIVLLLDDNPNPKDKSELERLNITRNLGENIEALLSTPYLRFSKALSRFENYIQKGNYVSKKEINKLIEHYDWAANWLYDFALKEKVKDHVDDFFVNNVLKDLASDFSLISKALSMSVEKSEKIESERLLQLYRRLAWTFKVKIDVFERKMFASLSHEANKAMNLNSYIGLMGGNYKIEKSPEGLLLIPAAKKSKYTVSFPDSDFLLTLDADSVLLREYCLRLVYFLEQPGNSDVAVTQTPYSSFPNPKSRIERLAGATTDIQHILHQGMSNFGATFWVGANAVIRKNALEDIVETEWVGGFEIKRYIQDRTVIEDTESSIDLAFHGWKLMNYPERLSYSATPPDFGSLVVQRRRWANGGLIILPKFFSQIARRQAKGEMVSKIEIMLRLNYLASIAWATFGLIFLLAYPYDGRLLSPLVLLAALPYFLTMASDLKYSGYKYTDIFRIYGFNLIMLPVNLAGVIKSIEQSITGRKIPFARTPKVKDRTAASIVYLVTPLLIVSFSIYTVWRNIELSNWGNASFAAFNAVLASWAIISYIGLWNMVVDIWYGIKEWLYVEDKGNSKSADNKLGPETDWKVILYHGEEKGQLPFYIEKNSL